MPQQKRQGAGGADAYRAVVLLFWRTALGTPSALGYAPREGRGKRMAHRVARCARMRKTRLAISRGWPGRDQW